MPFPSSTEDKIFIFGRDEKGNVHQKEEGTSRILNHTAVLVKINRPGCLRGNGGEKLQVAVKSATDRWRYAVCTICTI